MMMLEICEGAHHALSICVLCNVDDVPAGGGC